MESSENGNPTYISLRASSKGKYLWKRTKLKENLKKSFWIQLKVRFWLLEFPQYQVKIPKRMTIIYELLFAELCLQNNFKVSVN